MNPETISLNGEYGGKYNEEASKHALWVVSWNIRNLSDKLIRPGARGNGVPLKHRLLQLRKYVRSWQPDVMFILECGHDDAKTVCDELKKEYFLAWTHDSKNRDKESCIVLLSKRAAELVDLTVDFDLFGPTVQYNSIIARRPALLRLNTKTGYICLLALHAPSPACPLKDRIQVIATAANACRIEYPNDDIILCGDLNIKQNEMQSLQVDLNLLGFRHVGPNSKGHPIETSLRKYYTILEIEDSESQPYDQFWYYESSKRKVSSCYTFFPVVRDDYEEHVWVWLEDEVSSCTVPNRNAYQYGLTGNPLKDNADAPALLLQFVGIDNNLQQLSKLKLGTRKLFEKRPVLRNLLTLHESVRDAIDQCKDPNGQLKYIDGVYRYVCDLLRDYNRIACMVVNFYKAYRAGDKSTINSGLFEMAMSDHKPVVCGVGL